MSSEDQMTVDERRKYLHTMKKRYAQADRRMKGQPLDEMEAVTGLDRKTLPLSPAPLWRRGTLGVRFLHLQ